MIEISPLTLTHSVTDCAIRDLPFRVLRDPYLGAGDLLRGPHSLQARGARPRLKPSRNSVRFRLAYRPSAIWLSREEFGPPEVPRYVVGSATQRRLHWGLACESRFRK